MDGFSLAMSLVPEIPLGRICLPKIPRHSRLVGTPESWSLGPETTVENYFYDTKEVLACAPETVETPHKCRDSDLI